MNPINKLKKKYKDFVFIKDITNDSFLRQIFNRLYINKKKFYFNIDVVAGCNLKCPSCPSGNWSGPSDKKGVMKSEMLEKILKKAVNECEIFEVGLFNWTEPLIHPQLAELIEVTKSYNLPCSISTNLNIFRNIEDILKAEPYNLRLSISGFDQKNYGVTHRGGDIERVKENMKKLSEIKEKTGSRTNIEVLFHRYKHNQEDMIQMQKYCENLNIKFNSCWASFGPIEKIVEYMIPGSTNIKITDEDLDIIDKLAIPHKQVLSSFKNFQDVPCILRDLQMTIDSKGNVTLCCGVYDSKYNLTSFLDTSFNEIQKMKYKIPLCKKCMSLGVHVMAVYGAKDLDKIGQENVLKYMENQNIG